MTTRPIRLVSFFANTLLLALALAACGERESAPVAMDGDREDEGEAEVGRRCVAPDWACDSPASGLRCDATTNTWVKEVCPQAPTDGCAYGNGTLDGICTPAGCTLNYTQPGLSCGLAYAPPTYCNAAHDCVKGLDLVGTPCPVIGAKICVVTRNEDPEIATAVLTCNTVGRFEFDFGQTYGPMESDCGEDKLLCQMGNYNTTISTLCPCGKGATCDNAEAKTVLELDPTPMRGLEFGPIFVDEYTSRSLQIRHRPSTLCAGENKPESCYKPIHLSNFRIEGSAAFGNPSVAPAQGEPPVELVADGEYQVLLSFAPQALGLDYQAFLLFDADADKNPYGAAGQTIVVPLYGSAVVPGLCANPWFSELRFMVGVSSSASVDLYNCGPLPEVTVNSVQWANGYERPAGCEIKADAVIGVLLKDFVGVEVACTPPALGAFRSAIDVVWNDDKLYRIPFYMEAVACEPVFSPADTLEIHPAYMGETRTAKLLVRNPCGETMRLTQATITQTGDEFTLPGPPVFPQELGPQATRELEVAFKAPFIKDKLYEAQLTIGIDSKAIKSKTIALRAVTTYPIDGDTP